MSNRAIQKILVSFLVVLSVAACGAAQTTPTSATATAPAATPTASSDKYEGTWAQQALGLQKQDQMPRLVVKKVGDQYAFTDPSGKDNLIVLQTEPDAAGKVTILAIQLSDSTLATVEGNALKLSQGKNSFSITVDSDTMTWVQTSGDELTFTLTREA